jgi:hypothetical protein
MKEAKMVGSPKLNLYPLSYYTFFSKEPKMEKDASFDDRLVRMKSSMSSLFLLLFLSSFLFDEP